MKLYRISPLVCALALVSAPVSAEGDATAGRQKTWTCEGCHGIPDYRTAYPEVPPRVEYRLTPLGQEVAEHVEGLVDWLKGNLPRVLKARAARHSKA